MAVEPFLGTRAQRGFMGTILAQAVIVIIMVGLVFNWMDAWVPFNNRLYKTIPCYLALFILAELFELFIALDALRARNIIQIFGIMLFHFALIIFSGIQIRETSISLGPFGNCAADGSKANYIGCTGPGTLWRKVQPLLIVAPCVIGASWFIMMWFTKELLAEFGWAIFHIVGANPKMKRMFRHYQIFICLLKLDFFCFTGVTVQLLIVVLAKNSAEFGLTIAAIPVVLILLAGAGLAVQREIKWLMFISLVMMLAAETYFVYKLDRFYDPSSSAQYTSTRGTLTTFTIFASLILFATFGAGIRCLADFDKGLLAAKVHGQSYAPVSRQEKAKIQGSPFQEQKENSYQGGFNLAPRISIE